LAVRADAASRFPEAAIDPDCSILSGQTSAVRTLLHFHATLQNIQSSFRTSEPRPFFQIKTGTRFIRLLGDENSLRQFRLSLERFREDIHSPPSLALVDFVNRRAARTCAI
jgi:hypothetical protein